MNHTFSPSLTDVTICGTCKYDVISHTDMATCECCPKVGNMNVYAGMLLCSECIQKEKDHQSPEKQAERLKAAQEVYKEREINHRITSDAIHAQSGSLLNIDSLIDKARVSDMSVQVRTDIHNADTVAIIEVFAAVDANPEVPADKKAFAKAEFLKNRVEHFQKVIFDANQQIIEANNHIRVHQSELNKMVNLLRADEREKLKLATPEYKPAPVKSPSERKPRAVRKPAKFDKKELMDAAVKIQLAGIPMEWHVLQMMCTRRDMTPKQAVEEILKRIQTQDS